MRGHRPCVYGVRGSSSRNHYGTGSCRATRGWRNGIHGAVRCRTVRCRNLVLGRKIVAIGLEIDVDRARVSCAGDRIRRRQHFEDRRGGSACVAQ